LQRRRGTPRGLLDRIGAERIQIRGHDSEGIQRAHADDLGAGKRTGHDALEARLVDEAPKKALGGRGAHRRRAQQDRCAKLDDRAVLKDQRGDGRVDGGALHRGAGGVGGGIGAARLLLRRRRGGLRKGRPG
jgi:hypothetical protein